MSNSITTTHLRPSTSPHQHPPSHAPATSPSRVRFIDRITLRVGLALITWSRRSRTPERWERRATRVQQQLARTAREQAALRRALQIAPPR